MCVLSVCVCAECVCVCVCVCVLSVCVCAECAECVCVCVCVCVCLSVAQILHSADAIPHLLGSACTIRRDGRICCVPSLPRVLATRFCHP